MRTIIALLFLTSILVLFNACVQKNETYSEASVLVDITDKLLVLPKADEIMSVYHLENKWNGAVFHYSTVSDVSRSKTYEAHIEPENKWVANEPKRDKTIRKFKSEVSDILSDTTKQMTGKNNSSVYIPITEELNRLAKQHAQRKILIVFSDLMENSAISFYNKKDFALLQTKPELIQKELEKSITLNSLTGVEVWFIYQAPNIKNDEQYRIVSDFYYKLLESKGAEVHIGANLNF